MIYEVSPSAWDKSILRRELGVVTLFHKTHFLIKNVMVSEYSTAIQYSQAIISTHRLTAHMNVKLGFKIVTILRLTMNYDLFVSRVRNQGTLDLSRLMTGKNRS